MTKSQIKAELRRSACEDKSPFWDVDYRAYNALSAFRKSQWTENLSALSTNDLRNFYLLVAEAL